jgi:peptide/nickel transport system substrate-binding protein
MATRLPFLTLFVILATACASPRAASPESGSAPASSQPGPDQTRMLVMATRNEPSSVAAKPLRFVASQSSTSILFSATLDAIDERGKSRPYLAEAIPQLNTDTWRVFPDGRMETTYRLKPNLTWHDGAPLSAEDFAFAWRLYSAPEHGVSKTIPLGSIDDITAPDARTVVIQWRTLYPDADSLREGFQPLPRHILEQPARELDPESLAAHPFWQREYVGLGPYRMDSWEPGAYFEGRAFAGYVLGKPKIERLQVRFIPDNNTVLANLLADEVHIAVDFSTRFEQGEVLEQEWGPRQGGTVLMSPTLFWRTYFQFRPDIAKPRSLLDVRVRRAIAHAIDKQAINEALIAGKAVLADSNIYAQEDYYPEVERVITKYPYDVRRAQQLLEETGMSRRGDGFYYGTDGEQFAPEVYTTAATAQEAENAIIVDGFRRAGIAASSHIIPARLQQDGQTRSTFASMQTGGGGAGERGFAEYRTAAISGPDNRWTGPNRGGYSNEAFDRIWEAYSTALPRPERIQRIAELARIFSEEVPAIPHFYQIQITPHVAALRGPMARVVPDTAPEVFNINEWSWRS